MRTEKRMTRTIRRSRNVSVARRHIGRQAAGPTSHMNGRKRGLVPYVAGPSDKMLRPGPGQMGARGGRSRSEETGLQPPGLG